MFMIGICKNFSVRLIGIGVVALAGTSKQYPRIGAYIKQSQMKR